LYSTIGQIEVSNPLSYGNYCPSTSFNMSKKIASFNSNSIMWRHCLIRPLSTTSALTFTSLGGGRDSCYLLASYCNTSQSPSLPIVVLHSKYSYRQLEYISKIFLVFLCMLCGFHIFWSLCPLSPLAPRPFPKKVPTCFLNIVFFGTLESFPPKRSK
jgi:hypothetical protein